MPVTFRHSQIQRQANNCNYITGWAAAISCECGEGKYSPHLTPRSIKKEGLMFTGVLVKCPFLYISRQLEELSTLYFLLKCWETLNKNKIFNRIRFIFHMQEGLFVLCYSPPQFSGFFFCKPENRWQHKSLTESVSIDNTIVVMVVFGGSRLCVFFISNHVWF